MQGLRYYFTCFCYAFDVLSHVYFDPTVFSQVAKSTMLVKMKQREVIFDLGSDIVSVIQFAILLNAYMPLRIDIMTLERNATAKEKTV